MRHLFIFLLGCALSSTIMAQYNKTTYFQHFNPKEVLIFDLAKQPELQLESHIQESMSSLAMTPKKSWRIFQPFLVAANSQSIFIVLNAPSKKYTILHYQKSNQQLLASWEVGHWVTSILATETALWISTDNKPSTETVMIAKGEYSISAPALQQTQLWHWDLKSNQKTSYTPNKTAALPYKIDFGQQDNTVYLKQFLVDNTIVLTSLSVKNNAIHEIPIFDATKVQTKEEWSEAIAWADIPQAYIMSKNAGFAFMYLKNTTPTVEVWNSVGQPQGTATTKLENLEKNNSLKLQNLASEAATIELTKGDNFQSTTETVAFAWNPKLPTHTTFAPLEQELTPANFIDFTPYWYWLNAHEVYAPYIINQKLYLFKIEFAMSH